MTSQRLALAFGEMRILSRYDGMRIRVIAGCGLALGAGLIDGEGANFSVQRASALPLQAVGLIASAGGADHLQQVEADAAFKVENAIGPAGRPLPLSIRLPQDLPQSYSFVMFRGLPEGFSMSSGFRVNERWVVSLRDIAGLKLIPAADYRGMLALQVMLMRGKDAEPERRTITVDLTRGVDRAPITASTGSPPRLARPASTQPAPARPAALPQAAPGRQNLSSEDKGMLERADGLLGDGDVAAARLMYTRIARRGIAEGAFGMAKTFDPAFLRHVATAGLQPDLAKAQEWYRKAEQLGSAQATTRLSELASAR